jgi:hypothetical protein
LVEGRQHQLMAQTRCGAVNLGRTNSLQRQEHPHRLTLVATHASVGYVLVEQRQGSRVECCLWKVGVAVGCGRFHHRCSHRRHVSLPLVLQGVGVRPCRVVVL